MGSVACVGVGMMLGAHISPRAKSYITSADKVFVLVSSSLVEEWVFRMNPNSTSLQEYYREGKSRYETYSQMTDAIMARVRLGEKVCAVFYGHPGVFACVPHRVVTKAREEGHFSVMEPGISAEDCLYADLGVDPGEVGCQHYEASQFMFYRRRIDASACLVLWQVGLAGIRDTGRFSNTVAERALLVDRLSEDYPRDHLVTLYEAATLPGLQPRMEQVSLEGLVEATLHQHTTLVVPPARAMVRDERMFNRLQSL